MEYGNGSVSCRFDGALVTYNGTLVGFSPDESTLVTLRGRTVSFWNTAAGQARVTLNGHERDVTSVAFSSDGRRIVTGSADGTAKIWDSTTGQMLNSLLVHRVRRLPRYRIVSRVLSIPLRVVEASFSPDGRRVLAYGEQKSLSAKLFDATTGQLQAELGGHTRRNPLGSYPERSPTETWRASFSPDGRFIVTESISQAKLWETETGRLRETVGSVYFGEFTPDGNLFGLVSRNGVIGLLNIETGDIQPVRVNLSFLNQLIFSSDSRTLVTGSGYKDYRATFVDVPTGQVRASVPAVVEWGFDLVSDYQKNVDLLSFHPNNRIVMGANNDSVRFLNAATGQVITERNEGREPATFNPSGTLLVTTGRDRKTVLLWEVTSY